MRCRGHATIGMWQPTADKWWQQLHMNEWLWQHMDEQTTTHGWMTTWGEQAQLPPTTDFSHRESKCHVTDSDVATFVHWQCSNATSHHNYPVDDKMDYDHPSQLTNDGQQAQMETDNKEPRSASLPPPTTDLSNTESRCDVATKWRTTTSSCSLSLYILACHSQCPIPPHSSQPTLLIHRMTTHDHPLTADIPRQQQRHVASCTLFWWHMLSRQWQHMSSAGDVASLQQHHSYLVIVIVTVFLSICVEYIHNGYWY